MTSAIVMVLALTVVVLFLYAMLFIKEENNKVFLKFVFLSFPFLGIDLLPSVLSTSIFVFLTILFFGFFYKRRVIKSHDAYSYLTLFILLLSSIGVGFFLSTDLSKDSLTDSIQLLALFFFAKVLIDELYFDPEFRNSVFNCMKITLIFSFVFLIFQFVFGPSFSFAKSQNINVAGGMVVRYPSFFQDPQKYAQYLSASSLLMLLLPGKTKGKISQAGLILCGLSMIALLFTGGRAALGGWLLGLLMIVVLGNAQYRAAILTISLFIALFILNYADKIPILKRDDLSEAYAFRYAIWQDAFDIFWDHPFFGIGLGNYANYVAVHNPDQYWISDNEVTPYDHPESGYLKLLTEFGFIGFLITVFLIAKPVYSGLMTYFKTRDLTIVAMVSSIFTWLVGFYTVYSLGDIRIKILIASIICMLIASSKKNAPINNTATIV